MWTARAANTGVSALIDARGQVRERTQIFEQGLLVGDVPLRDAGRRPTFYARHGDVAAARLLVGELPASLARDWRRRAAGARA